MGKKIIEELLSKTIFEMKKNTLNNMITRKDCFKIMANSIRFDKEFSKMILKELEIRGFIKNVKRGVKVR